MIDEEDISDKEYEHNWRRRHKVLNQVQLSVLYHRKRERFFDSLERLMQAVVTASATGGVALLLASQSDKTFELWFMAATAAVSMIQLAYAPGAHAKQHAQLATEYHNLWAEGVAMGEVWSHVECDAMQSRALKIGAAEPPQLGAVIVLCENEIAMAAGQATKVRALPLYMRMLKHLWNFDVTNLRPAR